MASSEFSALAGSRERVKVYPSRPPAGEPPRKTSFSNPLSKMDRVPFVPPDDVAGQAGQDRWQDGASCAICDLPTGRGGGAASAVPNDPGSDSTVRSHPPEGRANMTEHTGDQPDNRRRRCDGLLDTSGSKNLAGPPDRCSCPQSNIGCRSMKTFGLEISQEPDYRDTRKAARGSRG